MSKTVNQLTEDASPTIDDFLLMWDAGSGTTKKVAISSILSLVRTQHDYEILGRHTLSGAADTLTVASFTARKYLLIRLYIVRSGNVGTVMRFNADSGNNYAFRRVDNQSGSAGTDTTSNSNIPWETGTSTNNFYGELVLVNYATGWKQGWMNVNEMTSSAAAIGNTVERFVKWTNAADQITTVTVTNDESGDFDAGSELVILGHD